MKNLTIALFGIATIALCSFAFINVKGGENTVDPKTYKKFIAKFEEVNLPYTLAEKRPTTYEELDKMNETFSNSDKYLSREFGDIIPDLQRGMYSRMGPDDYQAEVMLASNKHFDAIIYSRIPSFRGGKTYYVATFDKSGKMINKMTIASIGYGQIEEARIGKDLTIHVDRFKMDASDEVDNEKLTYHLEQSREILINPSGNIIESKMKAAPTQQKAIQSGDLGFAD